MKQLWFAMSLMAGSLFFSANASADVSSGALLQQMNLASQSPITSWHLSASISRVSNRYAIATPALITSRSPSFYRWMARVGKWSSVGTKSAISSGLEPFTLNGDYIVDSLPSLIYTDFKRLAPTMILSRWGERVLPTGCAK